MSFNIFDILMVALPLAFLVLGFIHSAWSEFFSLVGVALGALGGAAFSPRLVQILVRAIPDKDLSAVIAFLAVLACGWVLGSIAGGVAQRMQGGSRSEGSRLLPAVFGALKGAVLAVALVWLVEHDIPAFTAPLRNATLTNYANEVLSFLAHHNLL